MTEVRSRAAREPQEDRWRCFTALLPGGAVLDELRVVQRQLRERLEPRAVRWARVDQLHLTLRFLGDVPERVVPAVVEALALAVARERPLRLTLGALGVFPDACRPRVLWAGLTGDVEELEAMQTKVETAVGPFGGSPEKRRFHPHLTLGRVTPGGRLRPDLGRVLEAARPEPVAWTVRGVDLMRSELRPEGARYTVVSTAALSELDLGRGDQ